MISFEGSRSGRVVRLRLTTQLDSIQRILKVKSPWFSWFHMGSTATHMKTASEESAGEELPCIMWSIFEAQAKFSEGYILQVKRPRSFKWTNK